MPGPNISGSPNPNDYIFGRGEVYVAELDPTTDKPTGGFVHAGNCPDFSQNLTSEKAEHYSSMSGLKSLDSSVIVSETAKLTFTLEEFNEFNLSGWLKGGDAVVITNPAVAGFGPVTITTSAKLGRWYDIINASGVHAYNIQSAKVTLQKVAGPVTLVEGTDYQLDLVWGRFKLLSTAVNVAAGDSVQVTLAADATSVANYRRIQGLTQTGKKYSVLFIFKNAANADHQLRVQYHKVSLDPNGDLALITPGTNYGQMKFECEAEKSANPDVAASPTVSVDYHAAA